MTPRYKAYLERFRKEPPCYNFSKRSRPDSHGRAKLRRRIFGVFVR